MERASGGMGSLAGGGHIWEAYANEAEITGPGWLAWPGLVWRAGLG